MNTQKRLYRSREERMFAGVCGGIAEYLDVDPTLVRLVFVALTLLGGPGFIIYIVLMLIVPEGSAEPRKAKNEAVVIPDDVVVNSTIPVPDEEDAPAKPEFDI
ncbi:MAG TPA: PspC domain-containing protein [Aggregatilinea sp.]|uniref:PspC domain-containing protein n=1 Tax=Aggregatilinea sp. TaxID=2806333 RepID=UPI002C2BB0AC|nr:PspC domain-containing protein [Aggregatilinea sp.]HML20099.1 PspC domain-containing protein [Aggregatilinea sp.]